MSLGVNSELPCAAGSAPVWGPWSFTTAQQLPEQLREEGSSSCCACLILGNKACHWAGPLLEFMAAWLLLLGLAASGHEDLLRGLWMSRDGASCGLGPLFPPLMLGSAGSMELLCQLSAIGKPSSSGRCFSLALQFSTAL